MLNQNNINREETPIKSVQNNAQNSIKTYPIDNNNNMNSDNNNLENNRIQNNQINNNNRKINNNNKESESEFIKFWKPDCCFCSESYCCNCAESNNFPIINIPNALIFTIISLSIILFILFLFMPQDYFDGHEILSFIYGIDYETIIGLYIIFAIETMIHLPIVIYILPWTERGYPSWAADSCCDKIFQCITMIQCCCCVFCCMCVEGCDLDSLTIFTSKCIRFIYKTGFYFYNIFFIPTIILYYCHNEDINIEQKRIKWVFYVILSFLIIDILSFIHVLIYGNKTNYIRNCIFGLFGFLASFFIYKNAFEVKIYKYLLIPTAYYYLINNYFVFLMTKKWNAKLYPIYGSVGYLFVFLAIPIIIVIFVLVIFNYCREGCCNTDTVRKNDNSNRSRNNTPPVEEVEEQVDPFDNNNNENNY